MAVDVKNVQPLKHHEQSEVCGTRPSYRQGRKDTAVKVYTVNKESVYLMIMGVPNVGALQELRALCSGYGEVISLYALDEYPSEEFTETYLVCYSKLQSSRFAKRKLDGYSFFGGVLHVCYAPEFETVEQTRSKLLDRQKYVSIKTRSGFSGPFVMPRPHLQSAHEDPSPADENIQQPPSDSSEVTYIWAGKTYTVKKECENSQTETSSSTQAGNTAPETKLTFASSTTSFLPRQLLSTKRKAGNGVGSDSVAGTVDPYDAVSSTIRSKLMKVSAPNVDVKFKKKS